FALPRCLFRFLALSHVHEDAGHPARAASRVFEGGAPLRQPHHPAVPESDDAELVEERLAALGGLPEFGYVAVTALGVKQAEGIGGLGYRPAADPLDVACARDRVAFTVIFPSNHLRGI